MTALFDKILQAIKEGKKDSNWVVDFELLIFAILAGAIIFLLPILFVIRFINIGAYWKASVIGFVWLMTATTSVRDYIRKKFSWISGSVLIVWVVLTVIFAFVLV